MQLVLVDLQLELVQAWRSSFASFPEVRIEHSNILDIARHCIVSPANSYGFMDGGIDRIYRDFFGPGLEITVQNAIASRSERLLPVGASLIVKTGMDRIPYMIVAPTMTMPEAIDELNCYRAMRAVLRIADQHPELCPEIYCPGLGTGTGMVQPIPAAKAMVEAYLDWVSRGVQIDL